MIYYWLFVLYSIVCIVSYSIVLQYYDIGIQYSVFHWLLIIIVLLLCLVILFNYDVLYSISEGNHCNLFPWSVWFHCVPFIDHSILLLILIDYCVILSIIIQCVSYWSRIFFHYYYWYSMIFIIDDDIEVEPLFNVYWLTILFSEVIFIIHLWPYICYYSDVIFCSFSIQYYYCCVILHYSILFDIIVFNLKYCDIWYLCPIEIEILLIFY